MIKSATQGREKKISTGITFIDGGQHGWEAFSNHSIK
jgi:hypothetical protein